MQFSRGSKSTRASAESAASSRDIRYGMMPEQCSENSVTALSEYCSVTIRNDGERAASKLVGSCLESQCLAVSFCFHASVLHVLHVCLFNEGLLLNV